uniref:biotin--[acetyl-CoA-carboxylase] ligase n=1 Tax=Altererythrobacter segetis TaxID=1104773 RepID=UPI00140BC197|nr:biotin--[acetyl-CoA-carboxylase] ligase [Altererythrobacter segetis]
MIRVVPETGSTNADLLARLAAGERIPEGEWLAADRQTSGRGRQGRSWLDGPGNFMGSTVVHVSPHDPPPASLSFVAALAVYETVLARLGNPRELQLKWPNDVLLGGGKFCGLLLEREGGSVVIGVGVNLASAPRSEAQARALAELGPAPDRDAFAAELAAHFALEVGRWRQFGLEPILNRWLAAAHPVGSRLTVHEPDGGRISGAFDGLEPDGALRLRLADGSTRVIHAGDVMLGGAA